MTSDVSKTARQFFEKVGFEVIEEQSVVRKNVELTNYKMKKKLNRPGTVETSKKPIKALF